MVRVITRARLVIGLGFIVVAQFFAILYVCCIAQMWNGNGVSIMGSGARVKVRVELALGSQSGTYSFVL